MHEFSKPEFIMAFASRDETAAMPKPELMGRLDIIHAALAANIENAREHPDLMRRGVNDCLRGAILRLGQAYGDEEVNNKLWDIICLSLQPGA